MRHVLMMAAKFVGLVCVALFGFLILLIATNGLGGGWPAAMATVAASALVWWAFTRRPPVRLPGKIVLAVPAALSLLTVWLCVPVASQQRQFQAPSSVAERRFWSLPTGSRLAYWHVEPRPGAPERAEPIVFVHGGPGGYSGEYNRRFLARLASDGYDVWVYDQAGGGDSDLLPETAYSHERNVADFKAVLDEIGAPKVSVISQSYGAMILASGLADPTIRPRIAKAVFVEPGAYDFSVLDRVPEQNLYGGAKPFGSVPAADRAASALAQPRVLLGLLLPRGNQFLGQDEAANAFGGADMREQRYRSYCAADADRVDVNALPIGLNLKANFAINQQGATEKRSLKAALAGSRVPAMVMLGECSYVGRGYQTALIDDYPAIDRVAYVTGVGHSIWNGLDHHDAVALRTLEEFFAGTPPTIRNYPTKADVPGFLRERK